MEHETEITILWSDEQAVLTIEDLARATGLHPEQVVTFVRYGLIEPAEGRGEDLFAVAAIDRLRTIVRLRRDLGVNLAGVAAILEMQEHITELRREIEHLRRRLGLDT
ncbi:MAG TPA: chaperone modulator CbpM [Candidatus Polarisedimenticolia bacterium]|jgi:DNA-binding transcriptional MerR regulator|nr:chaperone modulator CbpM [Candidatus Polarisedimenticolia bacterium]